MAIGILSISQFMKLEPEQQMSYIAQHLHLQYYSDIVPDENGSPNRLLARVRKNKARNGKILFFADPVDCANGMYDIRVLFNEPGQRGIKLEADSQTAWIESSMISGQYRIDPERFQSGQYPISLDDIMVIDESDERILRDIQEARQSRAESHRVNRTRDELLVNLRREQDKAWETLRNIRDKSETELREILKKTEHELQSIREKSGNELQALQEKSGDVWKAVREQSDSELQAIQEKSDSALQSLREKTAEQWQTIREQSGNEWEAIHNQSEEQWQTIQEKLRAIQEASDGKLSHIQNRLKEDQQKREEFEAGCAALEERIARLADSNFSLTGQVRQKNPEEFRENPVDFPELTRFVKQYIQTQKGLFYPTRVIRQFLGSMFTHQMIILSGLPGTGKSSLPAAIAESIRAKCRIFSVQPDWTDNQDLLGFYNPAEELFVPTPFLDTLVEARDNPERIYLLCLDEMNLSHVEYYFSEIFSAMETQDKILHLYSPLSFRARENELMNQLFQIIPENARETLLSLNPSGWRKFVSDTLYTRSLEDMQNTEPPEIQRNANIQTVLRKLEKLYRYPAEFVLPDNIQFVGTLNTDETTFALSPKVLDRSYIIELAAVQHIVSPSDGQEFSEDYARAIPVRAFTAHTQPLLSAQKSGGYSSLNHSLQDIVTQFRSCGVQVHFSNRAMRQSDRMEAQGLHIDDIVFGKILPILRAGGLNSTAELEHILQACPQSAEKLPHMLDSELGELDFWRPDPNKIETDNDDITHTNNIEEYGGGLPF